MWREKNVNAIYYYLFFNLYKSVAFINVKILKLKASSGKPVYSWRVCVFWGLVRDLKLTLNTASQLLN